MKHILCCLLACACTAVYGQSYEKLHKKAIVADTHNDIPFRSVQKKVKFDSNLEGQTHTDLARMKKGGLDVQVFSIYCGPEEPQPYAMANREIDSVYEWTRRNPTEMMIVKTPGQLRDAIKQKKIAAMMGMEGGHMMENKLENLDALYQRGVRYMTLTWNNSTGWATSAKDETEKKDSLPHKGLTDYGRQIVKHMNELGMLVDLSHTGEQTFYDAIAVSSKPVIASHSCVWNLCPNRRNLKDDQIKAIGKNGGVIFLNFYAGFIDSNYEKHVTAFSQRHQPEIDQLVRSGMEQDNAVSATVEKYKQEMQPYIPAISVLLDHLDYIVKMIGVDHVGLGGDLDGISAPPAEIKGVQDYPLVTKMLRERGYSKKDIRKILGRNFVRVFTAAQSR